MRPGMDFPGGRVNFSSEMSFIPELQQQRKPCFRVLDNNGFLIPSSNLYTQVSKEMSVKMYTNMVKLQVMDTVLYEAQRQGRISFYLTSHGEEAINISSAAALSPQDVVFAQYREPGGDFHAGMNFAAVLEAPVVFVCRNNGWAISTPTTDQFRSDGVVVKGHAYGIRSIRVDGNDALAVYNALTYRVGHHSTSDDSTKYRSVAEIEQWKMGRDPLTRFRSWIERNGWWNDEHESQIRNNIKKEMIQAIQAAEKLQKPELSEMFKDVYDRPTKDLVEQERSVREAVERHPKDYPSDVPLHV
ncbi:hypothetical protein V2J09_023753 [Rumex salicifolius]